MYGAILGDIIRSIYEFDRGNKTKKFELFHVDSVFTDDTVMTIAVAEALSETDSMDGYENTLKEAVAEGKIIVLDMKGTEFIQTECQNRIPDEMLKVLSAVFRKENDK